MCLYVYYIYMYIYMYIILYLCNICVHFVNKIFNFMFPIAISTVIVITTRSDWLICCKKSLCFLICHLINNIYVIIDIIDIYVMAKMQ